MGDCDSCSPSQLQQLLFMLAVVQWPTSQNSLRSLAETYLGWTIQTSSHDSKQDAVAAMRLAKLKVQRGSFFGTSAVAGRQNLLSMLNDHDRSVYVLIDCS